MKRRRRDNSVFGKKNILLMTVALVLVGITAFGTSVSWIEDVSEVKFDNTSGQQTPAKIGSKVLESDIISRENTVDGQVTESLEINTIDLNNYFNRSGDIHLSPCFGDGEKFYFPVQSGSGFRVGTKDDANVNYLSATFRIRSLNADTVYWFEQSKTVGGDVLPYVTFSDGGSSVSGFGKYLRCSITVDGATNVYALDDSSTENVYDKTYKTVENGSITDKTGRNIEQFSYYEETFGSNNLPVVNNVANKDANGNLNGNTLFSVGKFDPDNKDGTIKTVTVKIWMECPTTGSAANTVSGVDISSININLVSSWGKTRRIFVHDDTVSEWDAVLNTGESNATGAQWLTNDSNAVLYWALEDSSANEGYRPFSKKPAPASGDPYVSIAAVSEQSHWFYMDIPAVYNNRSTALFRCNQQWNGGNKHTDNEKTIYYWDKWATTFPDTYHSEVFTIKSHNFATWRNAEDIQQVYFINSAGINENEMKNPHSYMWDSNTVVGNGAGDADKIVKNATWPGEPMTRLANSTAIGGKRLYTFFFLSEFNKAVFSDGRGGTSDAKGYQTQDIDASGHVGHYFDMSALTWYNTSTTGITYTGNYLRSNINQDGTNWAQTCFFHGGGFNETNANNLICRMYVKPQGENSTGNFKFQVKIGDKYYGNNASGNYYNWVDWDLTEGANDINITLDASSIYKFYLKNDNGAWKIKVEKES